MRRVTLDDLLRVAVALEAVPEERWSGQVVDWCEAAHRADAVRKRLGAAKAGALGAAHLGGRVLGAGVFRSERDQHRRLAAVLAGLDCWRARCG